MHIIVLPQFRATTYSAPVFMGQNTYSARWASSLATPPKAEEKNKSATRFQSEKISMSERTPKLHSSNIHTHPSMETSTSKNLQLLCGHGPGDFGAMALAPFVALECFLL